MEPPIGYGLAYRSISPESHFRTITGFGVMGLYENWVLPRLLAQPRPRCVSAPKAWTFMFQGWATKQE
jgi:hypothetical protein